MVLCIMYALSARTLCNFVELYYISFKFIYYINYKLYKQQDLGGSRF